MYLKNFDTDIFGIMGYR